MEKSPSTKGVARDEELSTNEDYISDLMKVSSAVEKGFRNQNERTQDQKDYWDIYECELNDNQAYSGNSQAYIPLTRDAIDARQTRFTNQIFPMNGRYIEVVSENEDVPHAEMALIEHYIDKCKLRTEVIPAVCKNGDVEGQYNVYVSWRTIERHVTSKKTIEENGVKTDSVVEEVILDEGPHVECLPDADVIVLPATSDSIEAALMAGGSVGITRRWSKVKIQQMIDDKEIVEEVGNSLLDAMDAEGKSAPNLGQTDMKKEHVSATGIKAGGNWYLSREVWHTLKIGEARRIVRSYFGVGTHTLLGTKLNPYWCDKVPLISAPVKKMSGSFKGTSLLKAVDKIQYLANDYLNQAADSATYSMMPIVMTDPSKNPKTTTMILDLAAIWETSPNDTQFAKFPEIWKSGFELIGALKAQIQQSLSVNPAMIPASSGKSKRSQADIANEQQVDLLTTADATTVIEQGILTPVVAFMVSLDMQFRHDELLIPQFGMMGRRAKMDRIPPMQEQNRYFYKWMGVQSARNMAQVQQQAAGLNVIKGIPPQMYQGHRLNLVPFLESYMESLFGPRLAPLIFVDQKDELSMDPEEENQMLMLTFDIPISPMDDDKKHIQAHQKLLMDPNASPEVRQVAQSHIQKHSQAMQMKAMAAQQQQMGQPQGGPREGAQPGQPRMQGPPGAVHQDRMPGQGSVEMPRRMAGGNA